MMMAYLLLYAYCFSVRSSRRIERLCHRDIGFRIISGNKVPDHKKIARFRQEYQEEIFKLYTQVLILCREAGFHKIGLITLDGTEEKEKDKPSAKQTNKLIEREVKKILLEAEAKDAAADKKYGLRVEKSMSILII